MLSKDDSKSFSELSTMLYIVHVTQYTVIYTKIEFLVLQKKNFPKYLLETKFFDLKKIGRSFRLSKARNFCTNI